MAPWTELQALRKRAGLTQDELGARIGTSGATVAHYEAGRRDPNVTRLRALAAALSVQPWALLGVA